jgi:replicative superfamily II helicase
VRVREFLGGSEYTTASGEALQDIAVGQVLVMTPEKCALALRQSPEAFEELALTIFDEAHLLGDRKGRGALSELVLSEVLARAPDSPVVLMSALIANPGALRDWLAAAHDHGRRRLPLG